MAQVVSPILFTVPIEWPSLLGSFFFVFLLLLSVHVEEFSFATLYSPTPPNLEK